MSEQGIQIGDLVRFTDGKRGRVIQQRINGSGTHQLMVSSGYTKTWRNSAGAEVVRKAQSGGQARA